jgi:hypothetical protein
VIYYSFTPCRDPYGYALTTSRRLLDVLRLKSGALPSLAASIAHDPTFALGHASLALLGHELCANVDIGARLQDASLHAARGTERERSHVHAVVRHVAGDSRPLVAHLTAYPLDALLLSTAVPTIAFAGVTEVPEKAWSIVERAIPAYGDDWWFTGLLAFVRQEQGRFEEAMSLSCASLAVEPGAGHSAHARAHAHYETGDHHAGLAWMDAWVAGTTRSSAPSTGSAAGRWSTPARCCSGGPSPPSPPRCPGSSWWPSWPAATCSNVPRRRSSRCTARSRCWRSGDHRGNPDRGAGARRPPAGRGTRGAGRPPGPAALSPRRALATPG